MGRVAQIGAVGCLLATAHANVVDSPADFAAAWHPVQRQLNEVREFTEKVLTLSTEEQQHLLSKHSGRALAASSWTPGITSCSCMMRTQDNPFGGLPTSNATSCQAPASAMAEATGFDMLGMMASLIPLALGCAAKTGTACTGQCMLQGASCTPNTQAAMATAMAGAPQFLQDAMVCQSQTDATKCSASALACVWTTPPVGGGGGAGGNGGGAPSGPSVNPFGPPPAGCSLSAAALMADPEVTLYVAGMGVFQALTTTCAAITDATACAAANPSCDVFSTTAEFCATVQCAKPLRDLHAMTECRPALEGMTGGGSGAQGEPAPLPAACACGAKSLSNCVTSICTGAAPPGVAAMSAATCATAETTFTKVTLANYKTATAAGSGIGGNSSASGASTVFASGSALLVSAFAVLGQLRN